MNLKKLIGGLVALALLVILYFGANYLRNNYPAPTNTSVNLNSNTTPPVSEQPQFRSFVSKTQGYSFSYPSEFEISEDQDLGPYTFGMPREIDNSGYFIEKTIAKVLPVEYCALSGKCTDETINFIINVGGESFSEKELTGSAIGKSLTKTKIADNTVYKYEEGAEGEGVIYYFVFGGNNKMVVFTLKYMNEQVMAKYQEVKEFTSYRDQILTVENMIKTLKFTTK